MNNLQTAALIIGGLGLPPIWYDRRAAEREKWVPYGDISAPVNPHVESKRNRRKRLKAERKKK